MIECNIEFRNYRFSWTNYYAKQLQVSIARLEDVLWSQNDEFSYSDMPRHHARKGNKVLWFHSMTGLLIQYFIHFESYDHLITSLLKLDCNINNILMIV